MKLFHIIVVSLLLLVSVQCHDKNPKPVDPIDLLPPATQTGENTFGCLVNGEAFVVANTSKMTAIYQQNVLILGWSIEDSNTDLGIGIDVQDELVSAKTYSLIAPPISQAKFSNTSGAPDLICFYDEYDTFQGLLSISYIDNVSFIVSGTFEFSTVTQACDTVRITNGRFDMQYIP